VDHELKENDALSGNNIGKSEKENDHFLIPDSPADDTHQEKGVNLLLVV